MSPTRFKDTIVPICNITSFNTWSRASIYQYTISGWYDIVKGRYLKIVNILCNNENDGKYNENHTLVGNPSFPSITSYTGSPRKHKFQHKKSTITTHLSQNINTIESTCGKFYTQSEKSIQSFKF